MLKRFLKIFINLFAVGEETTHFILTEADHLVDSLILQREVYYNPELLPRILTVIRNLFTVGHIMDIEQLEQRYNLLTLIPDTIERALLAKSQGKVLY